MRCTVCGVQNTDLYLDKLFNTAVCAEHLPKYSTDIEAAKLVVQKLKNEGFNYHFDDKSLTATFSKGEDQYCSKGEHEPHAICLAALKTRQNKV